MDSVSVIVINLCLLAIILLTPAYRYGDLVERKRKIIEAYTAAIASRPTGSAIDQFEDECAERIEDTNRELEQIRKSFRWILKMT